MLKDMGVESGQINDRSLPKEGPPKDPQALSTGTHHPETPQRLSTYPSSLLRTAKPLSDPIPQRIWFTVLFGAIKE